MSNIEEPGSQTDIMTTTTGRKPAAASPQRTCKTCAHRHTSAVCDPCYKCRKGRDNAPEWTPVCAVCAGAYDEAAGPLAGSVYVHMRCAGEAAARAAAGLPPSGSSIASSAATLADAMRVQYVNLLKDQLAGAAYEVEAMAKQCDDLSARVEQHDRQLHDLREDLQQVEAERNDASAEVARLESARPCYAPDSSDASDDPAGPVHVTPDALADIRRRLAAAGRAHVRQRDKLDEVLLAVRSQLVTDARRKVNAKVDCNRCLETTRREAAEQVALRLIGLAETGTWSDDSVVGPVNSCARIIQRWSRRYYRHVEALWFYARLGNWQGNKEGYTASACERDLGEKARQALGNITVRDAPAAPDAPVDEDDG